MDPLRSRPPTTERRHRRLCRFCRLRRNYDGFCAGRHGSRSVQRPPRPLEGGGKGSYLVSARDGQGARDRPLPGGPGREAEERAQVRPVLQRSSIAAVGVTPPRAAAPCIWRPSAPDPRGSRFHQAAHLPGPRPRSCRPDRPRVPHQWTYLASGKRLRIKAVHPDRCGPALVAAGHVSTAGLVRAPDWHGLNTRRSPPRREALRIRLRSSAAWPHAQGPSQDGTEAPGPSLAGL